MNRPFEVGDRVRWIDAKKPYQVRNLSSLEGTVGGWVGDFVCVHFDCPRLEKVQIYSLGWPPRRFELIDGGKPVCEDWS